MTLFAVSHIDWGNNGLVTEFHEAATWKEALRKHSVYQGEYKESTVSEKQDDMNEWFPGMPDDQEKAKQYAFDCDSMIEVVEVPAKFLEEAYARGCEDTENELLSK